MPRDLSYVRYIGGGWACIVGSSVAYSLSTNRHLLLSQRMIHARLYAQGATIGALCVAGFIEANALFFQQQLDRIAPPEQPADALSPQLGAEAPGDYLEVRISRVPM